MHRPTSASKPPSLPELVLSIPMSQFRSKKVSLLPIYTGSSAFAKPCCRDAGEYDF